MSNEKVNENEINNKEKEEINNLKKIQSEKEKDLNNNLDNDEKSLLDKQKQELDDLIKNFDVKIRPKISPYYLQLKAREYFLSRQDRFIEAQETKENAQKQYMQDNKNIDNEKKIILWKKIEELNDKHRKEYMKFIKDKNKKVYLLKKEEDKKHDEIRDKYKNIKENEVIKNTISNIMKKYNNKKEKIADTKFKRYQNNPFD